jgi:hypothetical protein
MGVPMIHRVWLGMAVTALSLMPSPAQAGQCTRPTVQTESPYHYIVSLTDALIYAQSGLDRTQPNGLGPKPSESDLLRGLILGKADFECAGSQVSPYAASSKQAIKASAEKSAAVFSRLADLHQESVDEHKALLDSTGKGNVKAGSVSERQAKLGASSDKALKPLIAEVIAGTYALVEADPTTGRMSRLALTRAQRDKILQKLQSTFGDDVRNGMKAGQPTLTAAAAAIYLVVGDQHLRLREAR